MPLKVAEKELFLELPLSWSGFTEKPQEEGTASVPQIWVQDAETQFSTNTPITADSLASQNPYQYILLPEENDTSVSGYLSNWHIDFEFNACFFNQFFSKKTFFTEKVPPPRIEGIPIYQGIQTEIWFTPLLFLIFVSYGLIFFRKKKMLLYDFKELFTGNEIFRKDSFVDNSQSRISLVISGIINISLFSFFALTHFSGHDVQNITLTLFLLLTITTLYVLFKITMSKLISYVFFNESLFSFWVKTFYSFILFLGISLIPIVLCLSFGPTAWITPVIYMGLFCCICLSILYIFKITTFFFQGIPSLFYLILYLCTLEILPFLIFLKELINIVTTV